MLLLRGITTTQSRAVDCPLLQEVALVLESISKDALGGPQGFNFLSPGGLAILVRGIALDARRLQILLVLLSCFQFIRHMLLVLCERTHLVNQAFLLVRLHLLLLGTLGLLNVIFLHVLIVGLLITSVCLHLGKIFARLLQNCDDASWLRLWVR